MVARQSLGSQGSRAWLKTLNVDSVSDVFTTLGGQLIHRLFLPVFSLLALFALLSRGRAVANRFLETCDRLFGEAGEGLVEKMVDTTRATMNGTALVAVGEG
jgi:predicted PurR-regulated permease PerM